MKLRMSSRRKTARIKTHLYRRPLRRTRERKKRQLLLIQGKMAKRQRLSLTSLEKAKRFLEKST